MNQINRRSETENWVINLGKDQNRMLSKGEACYWWTCDNMERKIIATETGMTWKNVEQTWQDKKIGSKERGEENCLEKREK